MEEALRQSEERFSKIFHANPLPMGLTTLAEGRYLDVNDSFLHLVGYRREEVIGHTSIELGLWADPEARTRMVQEPGAGQSVHELALDLRPAMLDDLGLIPALLWRCERYTAQTQVKVNFAHTGMATRFPPEYE